MEEQNAALRAAMGESFAPGAALGLTPSEARVLGILMKRTGGATKTQIMHAPYADRPDADEAQVKIVDVFVCKMRRKLGRFGVGIATVHGQGYILTADGRKKLEAMGG